DHVVGGVIAAGTVYPFVTWDADLGTCAEEPLTFGDPGATVRTGYSTTSGDATAFGFRYGPGLPPTPICAAPCANGGTCLGGDVCSCASGFDGPHCEIDLDPCDPDPCLNGGVCSQDVDGYTCACPPGYEGAECQTLVAFVVQPTVSAPADGASGLGNSVTLASSAFAVDGGADVHESSDLQVSTTPTFDSLVVNLSASTTYKVSYTPPESTWAESTTYYTRWRHRGAALGPSAWSPTTSFTTASSFLRVNTPLLSSPANGTARRVGLGDFSLVWVWQGTSYPSGLPQTNSRVQVASNSSFSSGVYVDTTLSGSTASLVFSPSSHGINNGTTVYWRVRTAASGGVWSDWSSVWSIHFQAEWVPGETICDSTSEFYSVSSLPYANSLTRVAGCSGYARIVLGTTGSWVAQAWVEAGTSISYSFSATSTGPTTQLMSGTVQGQSNSVNQSFGEGFRVDVPAWINTGYWLY
ncbi:MAG: hypothetical protein EP329_07735, partial [Deltaproteobacteria bacterium]